LATGIAAGAQPIDETADEPCQRKGAERIGIEDAEVPGGLAVVLQEKAGRRDGDAEEGVIGRAAQGARLAEDGTRQCEGRGKTPAWVAAANARIPTSLRREAATFVVRLASSSGV